MNSPLPHTFNSSTSDRCGKGLLSLHVQNIPRQWPDEWTWFSRHCRLALGRGPHPQTEWWKLNPSPKDILGPLWYQKGAFFLHVLNLRILRHDSCGQGAGRACGAFSRCTRSLESAVLPVWAVRSSHWVKYCFGKLGSPLPPSLTPSAFHVGLFLLDHSWFSVTLSVLNLNYKSKLVLLNQPTNL